jgi:hypothetical protein
VGWPIFGHHPRPASQTFLPIRRIVSRGLIYNPAVRLVKTFSPSWKFAWLSALLVGLLNTAPAQQSQTLAPANTDIEPKIQLSFVHSCRPEQKEVEQMQFMLKRVNERPSFATDFEISRGLETVTPDEDGKGPAILSPWVRIRREFPPKALLSSAQYSLSLEGRSASEVLALHLRDTDEALQILISTSAVGSAKDMVQSDTPPSRVQVERFGKAALVLARCPNYDQSSYEPVFRTADEIMRKFRAAMAVRAIVPGEISRLPHSGGARHTGSAARHGAGKTAGGK